MKASVTATTPGGIVITWDSATGFQGEMAELLNQDMQTAPGQTFTPRAEIARQVLLNLLPGSTLTDFVSVPLQELAPEALS